MIENPLVSIIIPVYNGSNYLAEAIDSALNQTYTNIEIIVVNDGSRDDGQTEAVALSYGDKIKYICKPNGGVSSALNVGILRMNGEYFSWLSHDDKYTPTKIASQVELLQKYRDKRVIALCGSQQIDKNSVIVNKRCRERFTTEFNGWSEALVELFERGTYNGCAFLIPKEYFAECGMFDEELRFAQDTLMWVRILASECAVVYNNEIGVQSRVHESQQTHKLRHLIAHDSRIIAEYIVPMLASKKQNMAIYLFAKRNAMLCNNEAVVVCKNMGDLSRIEKIKLALISLYGNIRPFIRKIYYATFWRMKTK